MTTRVYHHIEENDQPHIKFDLGSLSNPTSEYFVLELDGVTVFCSRQQAERIQFEMETYFNAEYLNEQARTLDVLSV